MSITAEHSPSLNGSPRHADPETDQLRARITELETALATTEHKHVVAIDELHAFKMRVVNVGERAAREHDWCSVYDRVLEDLGLERPARRVSGTLVITINFEATPNDTDDGLSASFVEQSIDGLKLDGWFDNDWSDVDMTLDSIRAEDLTLIQD